MSATAGKNKAIVILGPTGSGKTQLALKLAEQLSGEIVSADSRQIYKYLNIGTAKASVLERKKIPHYLIDLAEPDHQVYLPQYQKLALDTIDEIISRKKLPFLVGGTGLYLSAVIENYQIPEVAPQPELRKQLEQLPTEELILKLKQLDPEAAQLIYQNNKIKLIRAIEFAQVSGQAFFGSQSKAEPRHDYLLIGLEVDREELYRRINQRVDQMIEQGLEQEVRSLVQKFDWKAPAMMSIGYREWQPYFSGQKGRSEIIEEIKKDTRNYAKRQMTWFWRMEKTNTINWVVNPEEATELISDFLARTKAPHHQ